MGRLNAAVLIAALWLLAPQAAAQTAYDARDADLMRRPVLLSAAVTAADDPRTSGGSETGHVTVEYVVNPKGAVESAEVISSSGFPRLDTAATRAIRKLRFIPVYIRDQPVSTVQRSTVTFRRINCDVTAPVLVLWTIPRRDRRTENDICVGGVTRKVTGDLTFDAFVDTGRPRAIFDVALTGGAITSVRLVRSSGSPVLDRQLRQLASRRNVASAVTDYGPIGVTAARVLMWSTAGACKPPFMPNGLDFTCRWEAAFP